MKKIKSAYTLAEVLVALGIVGVLSAILIALVNNSKPDVNKITYLRSYKALKSAVKTMTHNPDLYQAMTTMNMSEGAANYRIFINTKKYPLFEMSHPNLTEYSGNEYTGFSKFGNLLRETLSGKTLPQGSDYSFVTENGVQWKVTPQVNNIGSNLQMTGGVLYGTFQSVYLVEVDINGNNPPNAIYTEALQKTPDRFQFVVAPNGRVKAVDVYGQYYLKTAHSWRAQKNIDLSRFTELDVAQYVIDSGVPVESAVRQILEVTDQTTSNLEGGDNIVNDVNNDQNGNGLGNNNAAGGSNTGNNHDQNIGEVGNDNNGVDDGLGNNTGSSGNNGNNVGNDNGDGNGTQTQPSGENIALTRSGMNRLLSAYDTGYFDTGVLTGHPLWNMDINYRAYNVEFDNALFRELGAFFDEMIEILTTEAQKNLSHFNHDNYIVYESMLNSAKRTVLNSYALNGFPKAANIFYNLNVMDEQAHSAGVSFTVNVNPYVHLLDVTFDNSDRYAGDTLDVSGHAYTLQSSYNKQKFDRNNLNNCVPPSSSTWRPITTCFAGPQSGLQQGKIIIHRKFLKDLFIETICDLYQIYCLSSDEVKSYMSKGATNNPYPGVTVSSYVRAYQITEDEWRNWDSKCGKNIFWFDIIN